MAKTPEVAVMQAWITPRADDPEAVSALAVARAAEARLTALTRARLVEIRGSRLDAPKVEALLHASTQFYNPHKEHCVLAAGGAAARPATAGVARVAVWERDGERRVAAERWWLHETGERVEVREAVVWEFTVTPAAAATAVAAELTVLRDARHGLLCNPWSQEFRVLGEADPLPWIDSRMAPATTGGTR